MNLITLALSAAFIFDVASSDAKSPNHYKYTVKYIIKKK